MSGTGRFGVLISGRGSNLEALLKACEGGKIPARVALVISNEPEAGGLALARARRIETVVIDHRRSGGREMHDQRMAEALDTAGCELICLAGYMRLLSSGFVGRYANRIMNIHPALLPSFPGLEAQARALEYGVKVSGATVHFVDEGLDHGPIIVQSAVPVREDDTAEVLSARILAEEHRLYPQAVRLFFERKLVIEGRRVLVLDSPVQKAGDRTTIIQGGGRERCIPIRMSPPSCG